MSDSGSDLFAAARTDGVADPSGAGVPPLAVRMRPRNLEEVRGQTAALRTGSPLRRLIEGSSGTAGPLSAIIWGPPGTGKTTLAHLVATAAEVVVLADASKVGVETMVQTVPVGAIDLLVTDARCDPEAFAELVEAGVEVRLAPSADGPAARRGRLPSRSPLS